MNPIRTGLPLHRHFPLFLAAALLAPALGAKAEIEDVIVTTQRVAESVLEVPHTVSVIDGDTISALGIDSIESFYHSIPGLNFAPVSADRTGVRLFIRGIGSTDALIGQDPSVSVYRDGIYQSRGQALNLRYSDIERIEVLKGPNGTLYGRNTLGGAINIVSRRASIDETFGKIGLSYGSHAQRSADAMVNTPFLSSMAVKVAMFSEAQDGWVKNLGVGPNFSGSSRQGFRIDLAYEIDDSIRFDYSVDRSSAQDSGYYYQPKPSDLGTLLDPLLIDEQVYVGISGARAGQAAGSNHDNMADSLIHSAQLEWDYAERHSFKLLTGFTASSSRSYANFDNAYSNQNLSRVLRGMTAKSRKSQAELIAIYGTDVDPNQRLTLKTANINDAVQGYNLLVNNYNSLAAQANEHLAAQGESPLRLFGTIDQTPSYTASEDGEAVFGLSTERGRPFVHDSYSIEMQFSGLSQGEQLGYVAGLYYFEEENTHSQFSGSNDFLEWVSGIDMIWVERTASIPRTRLNQLLTAATGEILGGNPGAAVAGLREASGEIAPLARDKSSLIIDGGSLTNSNFSQASSLASFFNLNYRPDDSWDFTVGLRLSLDSRSINVQRYDPFSAEPNPDYSHDLDTSFEHLNYHLVSRYRPSEDSNIYLVLTSSYRAGGFNESLTSTDPQALHFDKEEIHGYELGYKSDITSKMRLTSSLFLYQLPGLQYAVVNPTNPTQRSTTNTDGSVHGLDVEMLLAFNSEWSLALAYVNLERNTDSYTNPFTGGRAYAVSVQSPHNSVNMSVNGIVAFADLYEMQMRLGFDYNSRTHIVDGVTQEGYLLASIDINFTLEDFNLALWSKNLTDTAYIIDGVPFASANYVGPDVVIYGQPRTWGINAGYTF